ncbi:MAG: CAP domain-containing protein, partial [Clostridia bacterium]|nr:CAP domain-containing protein [Clostridia bacterium]
DMIKNAGISYKTAGENIAKGQKTAEAVFNAWMNSSGHRANILNSSYTQMGIGVTSGGTLYWSQMFIG